MPCWIFCGTSLREWSWIEGFIDGSFGTGEGGVEWGRRSREEDMYL